MTRTPTVKRIGFFGNVLWNLAGIGFNLFAAFVLSPIVIRSLGDENYGLWVVTTALVDYYWLIDFGLRAAIIRYSAHYNADGDTKALNELLATSTYYGLLLLPPLVLGTWFGAPHVASLLHISIPIFPKLVFIVGSSWGVIALGSTFTSCLEGLQRFDIINQSALCGIIIRSLGTYMLMMHGYGVVEMAYITVFAQVLVHGLNYVRLQMLMPAMSLAPRYVHLRVFREIFSYGIHSAISSVGQRILNQSPPLLISYFLSARFAGYFSNPRQVLDYVVEGVLRIGNVSTGRAAEVMKNEGPAEVLRFGITVNRLSLTVFLPIAIFLSAYGSQLLLVWIKKPEFVAQAAGVLPALLVGHTLALAAQYSTQSILFGIGRHKQVARNILIESVFSVLGLLYLVPKHGIIAAAVWSSFLLIVNRALISPWLLNRELSGDVLEYLFEVNRPLVAAIPALAAGFFLRRVVPGENWPQLILAGACITAVFIPCACWVFPSSSRAVLLKRFSFGLIKSKRVPELHQ